MRLKPDAGYSQHIQKVVLTIVLKKPKQVFRPERASSELLRIIARKI